MSATSREGRFLFKFGVKQLQNLILWTNFLANTVGTGTISTTNSFNLFGKTVNSAVSIAYGDRFFIPPGIPPLVPPILPVVPPAPPIINPLPPVLPPLPPVFPPFPPVFPPLSSVLPPLPLPGLSVVPFIPPVTTTAVGKPSVLPPVTANAGITIPPIAGSVKKGNIIITKGNEQTDETKRRQILDEYVELEKKNKKLLSEYNYIIKEQQKIATNQNEQWKEFLKQHNLAVDRFNDRTYAANIPRVNEL